MVTNSNYLKAPKALEVTRFAQMLYLVGLRPQNLKKILGKVTQIAQISQKKALRLIILKNKVGSFYELKILRKSLRKILGKVNTLLMAASIDKAKGHKPIA